MEFGVQGFGAGFYVHLGLLTQIVLPDGIVILQGRSLMNMPSEPRALNSIQGRGGCVAEGPL